MTNTQEERLPPIKALVLAGGRSTRMGQDKGRIEWHGMPQRVYLVRLLESLGIPTFVSCRPDQAPELPDLPLIVDSFPDSGPLGGIASAFNEDPRSAWLVVACDMPFVNAAAVRLLVRERRADRAATAFRSPAFNDDSPDPLFAIWEPAVAQLLTERLEQGKRCARQTLIAAGVYLLEPLDPDFLSNANTPEEKSRLERKISSQADSLEHSNFNMQ
ncbi:MAG: molybdenum cofactor guanylyltransferase [Saprospiraceae bacterium]